MAKRGRAWKLERAVAHRPGNAPRSNRYARGNGPKPQRHRRNLYRQNLSPEVVSQRRASLRTAHRCPLARRKRGPGRSSAVGGD
jgi:hypothetical protein